MQNIAAFTFFVRFLLLHFIKVVLVKIGVIVFFFFVDTISKAVIISSHSITEVSVILFKYLLF